MMKMSFARSLLLAVVFFFVECKTKANLSEGETNLMDWFNKYDYKKEIFNHFVNFEGSKITYYGEIRNTPIVIGHCPESGGDSLTFEVHARSVIPVQDRSLTREYKNVLTDLCGLRKFNVTRVSTGPTPYESSTFVFQERRRLQYITDKKLLKKVYDIGIRRTDISDKWDLVELE